MFDALQRWVVHHLAGLGRPVRRRVPPAALAAGDTLELPAVDDRPLGCGWFDSSHDLRAGLQVREHGSADAVSNELPLGEWLRLHLSEWRGVAPAEVGGLARG